MRITVHIPDNLGPKLKKTAKNEGISLSALTAEALEHYLKQKRKKAAGNRLLKLIQPGSVTHDAWVELEKGRADDRT
jgi:metal-responsive CopG/Arc/MetJ family transcriptional regulator